MRRIQRKVTSDIWECRASKHERPGSRDEVDTTPEEETDKSEACFFEGVVFLRLAHMPRRTRELFRIDAKDVLFSYIVAIRIGAFLDKVFRSQNNDAPDLLQSDPYPLSTQPGYASLVEFVRLMARRAARGWYDASQSAEST